MHVCTFLLGFATVIATATTAFAQNASYSVGGLTLGEKVHFDSKTYRQYHCSPSQQFEGFIWCQTKKEERERRGPFKAYYSILHSRDGTAIYINRFQEPAYWDDEEIERDIKRYSQKVGEEPRIIKGPSRLGLPETRIAVWGKVVLEPLDNESRKILAADKNVKRGVLIDTIGNYTKSAQDNLPLYRLTGGAGFVWIASNKNGRGILRILAINPSAYEVQTPPPPPQSGAPDNGFYSNIGFWTITHRIVGNLNGCDATANFRDQTFFQMAFVQSDTSNNEWLLFVANPRWNSWIGRKRQHTLRLIADKKWEGKFAVNDSNALWMGSLKIEFINGIADASSVEIFNDRNELLTSLDMTDSAAAIRVVLNCVREHPYVVATPKPAPVPAPEQETVLSGTGFFVAPNRLITNNHVVKSCRRLIEIRFADQSPHAAYIDAQDDTNDVALLHTDVTSRSVASFRLRPRVGERVATYGFPYSGILSSSGNFTQGDVSASTGLGDDTRLLQVSVPIQPGNSGGPLIDMSGSIVGMVTAQLSAFAMIPSGSIPQNVNFAIRSPIITNFLSVKGVIPKVAESDATAIRGLSPSDVADKAKEFTVQIYCKGVSQSSSEDIPVPKSVGWGVR
jgi:S1-C subfamily serine protease